MQALLDAFADVLLKLGSQLLVVGLIAFVASVPIAVRLRRKGPLFWSLTSILGGALEVGIVGLLSPGFLIGSMSIPILAAGMVSTVAFLPFVVAIVASRRAQSFGELAYGTCALGVVLTNCALVVSAHASV